MANRQKRERVLTTTVETALSSLIDVLQIEKTKLETDHKLVDEALNNVHNLIRALNELENKRI